MADHIITYLASEGEQTGTLCLEFIDGYWHMTTRNIVGEIIEKRPGLGNDPGPYKKLIDQFRLGEYIGVLTKDKVETMSPSKLETIAETGILI